ncbi:molybdate ABC transporter substrate-binding protein [Enemella evansiae]|uniref:molybdate ABC transporter substrate-binding protein n=1 Tax=Enemella evansiae TaxID=2016499 RepID=UPI000B96A715|nr:molybdate ABC transporter substrate-binding protein [Enemella evansiae]OYO03281.1 molybdate ABC transporter substrate-binding protein [Enemella evansiae]
MSVRNATTAAIAAIGVLALAACSQSPAAGEPAATTKQTITVYAAASLTKTFTQLGKDYQEQHPGSIVRLTFGGSADLLTQLQNGAPGDVLATADEATMTKAVNAKLNGGEPEIFATNRLTIATAPGNPKQITSLADLDKVSLVTCAPQVPCGNATGQVARAAGVTLKPVSEENSVTDVLGKVTGGQADAGIVYRTDTRAAGDKVTAVDFPQADQVLNRYPIVVLASSTGPGPAKSFTDFIRGPRGQQVLADAGFGAGD